MYQYESFSKGAIETSLPSQAINFNGVWLDEELESFRTLKVSGRETMSNQLTAPETNIGSFITNERLPHRELVITYKLENRDDYEFQKDFKELRKLLTSDRNVEIYFNDEQDAYYYGRLSTMDTVRDDTNSVVSTFTIFCEDPYIYGAEQKTTGRVTVDTFYDTLPQRIEITISRTTNNLEIFNHNHKITATGTFNAGSKVVFYFDRADMSMHIDGRDRTFYVDLNSDFENFYLQNGELVICNQGTLTLYTKERWL